MVKYSESIITTYIFTSEEICKKFNIAFDEVQQAEANDESVEITVAVHSKGTVNMK